MLTLQERVVQKVNTLSEDNLQFLLEMIERFMQPDPIPRRADVKRKEAVKGQELFDDYDKLKWRKAERKSVYPATETDKMKALEMLVPVSQELDYDKELAEARDEKYGNID